MYEVYLVNDDYTVIHSSIPSESRLTKMELLREINTVGTFDFSFLPNNPANALLGFKDTRLRIIRLTDNEHIFEGYVNQYKGGITTDNKTEIAYSADEIIGVFRDSDQPEFSFTGKVSEFLKKLVENHNSQVEPWKQFQVGVCELDTYTVYPDSSTPVNVDLAVGDKATIKQTTKHIWHDDGRQLNIASSVLGVTHTIAAVGTTGWQEGKYRLRHPNTAWGISGWIRREDIVEAYSYEDAPTTLSISGGGSSGSSKVTIKDSATVYYWDSYTTNPTTIPDYIKKATDLTINRSQYNNNRYALYRKGVHIAWISESDLNEGGEIIDPPDSSPTGSIQKTRTITAEVEFGSTWDTIFKHIIEEIGGEIQWRIEEGMYVIDILNQIGTESDLEIALEYNLQEIQEEIDSADIVTKVRAVGNPPQEETEDTATASVNALASSLGTITTPTLFIGGA